MCGLPFVWTELVCDTVPFPQRWPRWRFQCLRGHDSPSPNQGMSRILLALKYLEDVNNDDGHGAAQPREQMFSNGLGHGLSG